MTDPGLNFTTYAPPTYGVSQEDLIVLKQISAAVQQYPPSLINGNATLTYLPPTLQELATFYRDLQRLAGIQALERSLIDLMLDDLPFYLYAMGCAKGSIANNPLFTGVSPGGNEIGMNLIRAINLLNPTISVGSPVVKWQQAYGAAGWTDVFGTSANPVNLARTGLGVGATNTQGRVLLAFNALVDTISAPLLSEYRFHIGSTDYPVESISWGAVSDLSYAKLAAPVIIPVDGFFNMRGNILASGNDATQVLGLLFAPGNYLTYET